MKWPRHFRPEWRTEPLIAHFAHIEPSADARLFISAATRRRPRFYFMPEIATPRGFDAARALAMTPAFCGRR